MKAENWITEILDSTNRITLVVPDDALFLKIQNRIKQENTIPVRWIWIAAASFAILLSLNIKLVLNKTNSASKTTRSETEILASSISKTEQLY